MKDNNGSYPGSSPKIAIHVWTIHIQKYGRTIRVMYLVDVLLSLCTATQLRCAVI
jgi:hypothetical protein